MKLVINRVSDQVEVLLLKHKDSGLFSFINLTKGHICPCQFKSVQDALSDIARQPNVIGWRVVRDAND